ncbi:MAG: hypothetical protein WC774_04650 [Candidatus Gracilibacteria bacterium]|jgi:hypothetical protein
MKTKYQIHKDKNIELFKKYVKFYIEYFGLIGYELDIESQIKPDVRASCYWHELKDHNEGGGQIATISYSESWIGYETKEGIKKTAFHEVMELFLAKLRDFSKNTKFIIPDFIVDDEVHRIIRIMENKILPLIK